MAVSLTCTKEDGPASTQAVRCAQIGGHRHQRPRRAHCECRRRSPVEARRVPRSSTTAAVWIAASHPRHPGSQRVDIIEIATYRLSPAGADGGLCRCRACQRAHGDAPRHGLRDQGAPDEAGAASDKRLAARTVPSSACQSRILRASFRAASEGPESISAPDARTV